MKTVKISNKNYGILASKFVVTRNTEVCFHWVLAVDGTVISNSYPTKWQAERDGRSYLAGTARVLNYRPQHLIEIIDPPEPAPDLNSTAPTYEDLLALLMSQPAR